MLAHLNPMFSEIMTTLSSVDKIAAPKDLAAKLDAWERTRKVAAISWEKAAASTTDDDPSSGVSALAAHDGEHNNWGNWSRDPKACNCCGIQGHFAHECNVQPTCIQERIGARRSDCHQHSHSVHHGTDSNSSSGSDTSTSCSHSHSCSPSPPPCHNHSSSKSSSSK